MPLSIGIRELRQNASRYLRLVEERGEPIQITDRGRPVALLTPVPKAESRHEQLVASGRIRRGRGGPFPAGVVSLDAIHLAAALELGDDLDAIVTYDGRMRRAAEALGLPVAAPS